MLRKQHHIAIISSSWEKAKDFYIDKLGFQLIREVYRPEVNDYLRMLQQGDTVLELFIKPDAPQRVTNPEAMGLRHLAFHVENIEPAVAWLNSVGIETEPIREDKVNGGRFTFFKDPDGLPLELHE
jgi:glyoxylase I family protein